MTELKRDLSRKEQERIKPKPEDIIPLCLEGDMKKTALDFTAYLRTNKNKLVWYGRNAWKINYKGNPLCGIEAGGKGWWGDNDYNWVIILNLIHLHKYEEFIASEELKNTIWDSLRHCTHCNPKCAGEVERTVFDKELKGICRARHSASGDMIVWEPDEATTERIKKLLELEQKAREDNIG